MNAAPAITRYALYGEREGDGDPEFVHIEDIPTRARLYDWRITPHTHQGMFQLVHILDGEVEVWIDGVTTRVQGPTAVCVPGGVVHAFTFGPDTDGWVLTVTDRLLLDARHQESREILAPVFAEPRALPFTDDADGARRLGELLRLIQAELRWPGRGGALMFDWLIRAVLLTLRRRLDQLTPTSGESDARRHAYARFRQLVEDSFREHWPLTVYAEKLAMSQSGLNRLCKSFTGKAAGEIIQERLGLEARRLLIYTSAPAQRVAYELGFQDPAYFSRFFRRVTGMTPGDFRRANLADAGGGATPPVIDAQSHSPHPI